jgi:hypothetical protein
MAVGGLPLSSCWDNTSNGVQYEHRRLEWLQRRLDNGSEVVGDISHSGVRVVGDNTTNVVQVVGDNTNNGVEWPQGRSPMEIEVGDTPTTALKAFPLVFWVSRSALGVQHSAFSIQHSAFSVLRSAFCIQRSAFCIQRSAFSILRSAFCLLRYLTSSSDPLRLKTSPLSHRNSTKYT